MGEFKIVHLKELNEMTHLEKAFYNYQNEYTTFELKGELLNVISPNLTKIRRWIEKECDGEAVAILTTAGSNMFYMGNVVLCFEEETDAAAFKLRWM